MVKNSLDTQIKLAKITATQAIIVAFITTFGGGLTGWFLHKSKIKPTIKPVQHWVIVQRIDGEIGRHVRLIISVNGVYYTYPSQAVWAEIGPQMPSEKFPLPIGSNKYRISYTVYITSPGALSVTESRSQNINEIKLSEIPKKNIICEVYPIEQICRKAKPNLRIYYSVFSD